MDTIEKIKKLMEAQNISNADLARAIFDEIRDINAVPSKYRTRISDYLKGKANIPLEILKKIANYFNVDILYLLDMEDDKIPLTRYLPIIGSASCGVPQKQYFDEVEMYPVSDDIYKDTRYLVKADGDSMLPKIKHGDLVLCDTNLNVDNNDIVHYTINNDESGIKKAIYKDNKIVMLMPTNSEFSPIIIGENDIVRVAKCIKVISDL
jgi:SOS-response transcriptional repressor LexA